MIIYCLKDIQLFYAEASKDKSRRKALLPEWMLNWMIVNIMLIFNIVTIENTFSVKWMLIYDQIDKLMDNKNREIV